MKNSMHDSKKLTQKASLGYTSSYTDKYRKKATKPSFQLDRLHLTPQKSQIRNNDLQNSANSLSHSFQNSLNSSLRKLKSSESKVQEDQWIGEAVQTSNKHKNSKTDRFYERGEKFSQANILPLDSFSLSESILKKPSNILIQEQIQEDLSIYQQYRMLEEQYQQQLDKIKEETEKIQQQCNLQRKRIAESEQLLFVKKKKLRQLQDSYDKILIRNEAQKKQEQAIIKMYQEKLNKLKGEYAEIKEKHTQQIHKLENELSSTEVQNERLQKQLSQLESELERQNLSQSEQISTLQELESQQSALLQQIASLQEQQTNLRKQISELESNKNEQPMSNEIHKKYLEIYEKMFITNQLHKAEEILRMKDQERHEMQEIERRKSMIKDKKVEISLKQKRIVEKNKMIDKLTQEIRQKSTTLLNLYQQQ